MELTGGRSTFAGRGWVGPGFDGSGRKDVERIAGDHGGCRSDIDGGTGLTAEHPPRVAFFCCCHSTLGLKLPFSLPPLNPLLSVHTIFAALVHPDGFGRDHPSSIDPVQLFEGVGQGSADDSRVGHQLVGMTGTSTSIERRSPDGVVVVLGLFVQQAREAVDVGEELVRRVTVQTKVDRGGLLLFLRLVLGPVRRDERAGVGRHTADEGREGQKETEAKAMFIRPVRRSRGPSPSAVGDLPSLSHFAGWSYQSGDIVVLQGGVG